MGKSGNTCAVAICPSPKEASYHHFPHDEKLKKVWIACCSRKDAINPATAKICSNHFCEVDFVRDLQAELLGQKRRRKLQQGAIPSLNLRPPVGNHHLVEQQQKDTGNKSVFCFKVTNNFKVVNYLLSSDSFASQTLTWH